MEKFIPGIEVQVEKRKIYGRFVSWQSGYFRLLIRILWKPVR